jgi:hypothetical protein
VEAGINPHNDRYTEYTLPFNEENFQNLYKQRPTQSTSSVTLAIYVEGASDRPRQITDPELFSKKPFSTMGIGLVDEIIQATILGLFSRKVHEFDSIL